MQRKRMVTIPGALHLLKADLLAAEGLALEL